MLSGTKLWNIGVEKVTLTLRSSLAQVKQGEWGAENKQVVHYKGQAATKEIENTIIYAKVLLNSTSTHCSVILSQLGK